MSLKNRSILVTGGAGFIGSHLVDALAREEPENLVVVDNLYLGKDENLKDAKDIPTHLIYHQDIATNDAMQSIWKRKSRCCLQIRRNPTTASSKNQLGLRASMI